MQISNILHTINLPIDNNIWQWISMRYLLAIHFDQYTVYFNMVYESLHDTTFWKSPRCSGAYCSRAWHSAVMKQREKEVLWIIKIPLTYVDHAPLQLQKKFTNIGTVRILYLQIWFILRCANCMNAITGFVLYIIITSRAWCALKHRQLICSSDCVGEQQRNTKNPSPLVTLKKNTTGSSQKAINTQSV